MGPESEFSCKVSKVNSEGTTESVRIKWVFELKEFELQEFNCTTDSLSNTPLKGAILIILSPKKSKKMSINGTIAFVQPQDVNPALRCETCPKMWTACPKMWNLP